MINLRYFIGFSIKLCYYILLIETTWRLIMNKVLNMVIIGLLITIIVGCSNQNTVKLPNLEGENKTEIELVMVDLALDPAFVVNDTVEMEQSNMFIEYGQFLEAGDEVKIGSYIPVNVSKTIIDESLFFEPTDIVYDGPRLDDSFFDFDWTTETNGNVIGTGKAFEVEYESGRWSDSRAGGCIDGDTTVFTYPDEMAQHITSSTPSTRYFNVDTRETYPGSEEEFGQPATQYVCALLAEAETIVLQTDPGDNIVGNYGRFLAWVWVLLPSEDEYQLVNYNIVRQGLGTVEYLYGAGETDVTVYGDKTYTEWMFQAESLAMEESLGIHGDLLDYYWDYENDAPHPTRWP